MIGDYMTKPTQGALFRNFRDQIMGVVPARDPGPGKAKKTTSIHAKIDRKHKVKPLKNKRARMVLPGHKGKRQAHRSVLEKDVYTSKSN
jgi:hypothetical protein